MIIFRKEKPTAKELRDALADIDLEALAEAVSTATTERTSLLIDGSDEAILAAEERATASRLALDRATARRAELERRLVEAEQREADAKLEADRVKVEKTADALAKNLKRRYVDAATPLVALLAELEATERAVAAINTRLGDAGWLESGRAQLIPVVETRAFDWGLSGSVASILRNTTLKVMKKPDGYPDEAFPTWPPAHDRIA
jgi:hypothetical protein